MSGRTGFPSKKISIEGRALPLLPSVFLLAAVGVSWMEKENSCA